MIILTAGLYLLSVENNVLGYDDYLTYLDTLSNFGENDDRIFCNSKMILLVQILLLNVVPCYKLMSIFWWLVFSDSKINLRLYKTFDKRLNIL